MDSNTLRRHQEQGVQTERDNKLGHSWLLGYTEVTLKEALAELDRLERQAKTSIDRQAVETLLVGFAHDLGLEGIDEDDAHRYMQESGYFQDELAGVTNG